MEGKTLTTVFVFLLLIFILYPLGVWGFLYLDIWWYDIPLHLAGGAWVAILFFYLFEERLQVFNSQRNLLATFLLVLGFVALLGVLWEFYEYLFDVFVAKKHSLLFAQEGLADTMGDLVNDLLGGSVSLGVWIYSHKRKKLGNIH